jgi:hypothetical protein
VPLDRWRTLQPIERVDKPILVTEHRARLYQNSASGALFVPLPNRTTARLRNDASGVWSAGKGAL